MEPQTQVIRHVSLGVLQGLIQQEKDKHVFQRLLFIHQLYLGDGVENACERICVSKQTGYNWLQQWNEQGYEGLRSRFGGGKPPKLSGSQKEKLEKKLRGKDNWLTSEVRALIWKEFEVNYGERQVARILRGFKMHYAKPYPHDYRKPENAAELLAQELVAAASEVKEPCVFGFLDQAAPQTRDNKQRFWSFDKSRIIKNTSKYRANTFGFYPLNGKEVVEFMGRSTVYYVCEFLQMIRDKNPGKPIIVLLDNASSHIAAKTREFAKRLNITLVFLPPYSPDLNPIEQIWKSIRRRLSRIFVKSEWAFKETIRTTFHRLAKKQSFAQGWLLKFQPQLSNLL
jgi:transposase